MDAKLTVLIPCKDEEHNLVACVDAARPVADEILIADSGSTDRTLELVEQLPDVRLVEREFINYTSFKNWAIPQATHEWVLIVDADERVTPELAAEIRQVIAAASDEIDGFWIYRNTFFLGHPATHSGWQNDRVFRLIRRDRCRYRACRVHEGIDVAPERTGRLKHRLQHFTTWSFDFYFAKQVKYAKLGALDRWEAGRRASYWRMCFGPMFRFLSLYFLRGGWRHGMVGVQLCYFQAITTFLKEAHLWSMEHGLPQPEEPLLKHLEPSPQQARAA